MKWIVFALILFVCPVTETFAQGTRLLRHPTVSRDSVAFEYAGDLWVVSRSGGPARRLTSTPSFEIDPYFSPDGRSIAWLQRTDSAGPTGVWNIRLMQADGSNQRSVTNDRNINSKPEWSRDGALIFFHRFQIGGDRWRLFTVRPDGSGLSEIGGGAPGNNEFPSR